uniref:Putative secreted protein n=1 Tax=Rhipicephalus microplus TaxID=6941 RepID=A0A6G5A210_RHIMP
MCQILASLLMSTFFNALTLCMPCRKLQPISNSNICPGNSNMFLQCNYMFHNGERRERAGQEKTGRTWHQVLSVFHVLCVHAVSCCEAKPTS